MKQTHIPHKPQRGVKSDKKGVLKRTKCGKAKKQKVWEYMRRNKVFRVGDLMIVFDMKKNYTNWILWFFKKEGLLKQVYSGKKFEDSVWKVIKDIGVVSPITIIEKNRRKR